MIDIVGAIKAAFTFFGKVAGFFKDKQLLDAGKASQRAKDHEVKDERVKQADIARSDRDNLDSLRGRRFRD